VWTKISDGSIVDQNGKVIFFSTRRFIDDICIGNCCFMRSKPDERPFNDEHVFPEWHSGLLGNHTGSDVPHRR